MRHQDETTAYPVILGIYLACFRVGNFTYQTALSGFWFALGTRFDISCPAAFAQQEIP